MTPIKIIHTADIHIYNNTRFEEYEQVFEKLYTLLKKEKPQIVCIVGDLFDMFIETSNESKIFAGNFLNNLSIYCDEVIVTVGNHDLRKKNLKRVNSVETIVKLIDNKKVKYLEKSGFFDDELFPINWVNWFHSDKTTNPWKDIPHTKDKNKLYIDLFHDPINGCQNDIGYVFEKSNYRKITDFAGNISMFGDIHKSYQILAPNKIYSGSLIQQTFGEKEAGHGVVVWEIDGKTIHHRFVEIPNDYALVNFRLSNPDYDNLNMSSPFVVKHNKFRVVWSDHKSNVTKENELKIKRHLKDKYGVDDVRFQKFPYHTKIEDSKMISEVININDRAVQQSVIREYLKNNKYDDDFIEEIIKLDDIIDSRLDRSEIVNKIWDIDKLWFNNFKSYGDNNDLDLKIDGIIQINGINQYGKSTVLDAISYILYGKTIATMGKKPKHGDNRYINNKRNLNYCDGGAVLDINGDKYLIYRKTERKVNSSGDVTGVSTNVKYFYGTEMNDDNEMTDETGIKTQQMISDVLGDFSDFIRLALINSDNLSQMLSMIRSEFIDSIIKDAGYEIFDNKLEEFKIWRKEQNFEKIVLDTVDIDNTIIDSQKKIDEFIEKENIINDNISDTDDKIGKSLSIQEKLTLKVHKIDDDIMNLNLEQATYDIETYKRKTSENEVIIKEWKEIIDGLPSEFDYRKFNDDVENKSKFEKDSHKKELEIVEYQRKMDDNDHTIENVDNEIEMAKKKAINEKRNRINELTNHINNDNNKISRFTNDKEREIDKNVTKLYSEIGKLDNELNQLKSEGTTITNEIKSFENAKNGDKELCPTCNRPMEDCDENHLNKLIDERKIKLTEIGNLAKPKLDKKKEIQSEIEVLKESKNTISDSIEVKLLLQGIEKITEQIGKIEEEISNFDVSEIKDEIDKITKNKEKSEKENIELQKKIDENYIISKKLKKDIDDLEKVIVEKNAIKKGLEKRKDYIIKTGTLTSTNNEYEKIIQKNETAIKEYNKNLKKIEENKEINSKIDQSKIILKQLNDKKKELINEKIVVNNSISLYKKTILDLKERLKKYEQQLRRENMWGVYMDCMSRTGVPTYLLKQNIDLLNGELTSLLSNTNFNMFFDDDLNYKLEHNGLPGVINAIESSGMEITFSSLVLKIVLREINFRSKPNFLFLDEILNKLIGESVDKFVELLSIIKEKINKIIIIEHNNEIMADMIIDVKKDKNGISSFDVI